MTEHVLPLAVAHRGGNEVAHENTLEAFQDAIDLGYRRIETDVHYTRHGELLAVHGQTIDGSEAIQKGVDAYVHLGERAIRIADLTRADRQALAHDGLSIPTLEEALSLNREVYWNIDAKRQEAVVIFTQMSGVVECGKAVLEQRRRSCQNHNRHVQPSVSVRQCNLP